jgi:hypothetical protein
MKKTRFFYMALAAAVIFAAPLELFATGSADKGGGGADLSKRVEVVMYVVSNPPPKQAELDANLNKLLLEKLNCTLKINWIT